MKLLARSRTSRRRHRAARWLCLLRECAIGRIPSVLAPSALGLQILVMCCHGVGSWPAYAAEPPTADVIAQYLTTRDGTRLAADVYLPPGRTPGERLPVVLELTRYWRGAEDLETGERLPTLDPSDQGFLDAGYAVVQVDVRGTGASFGSRQVEYGPQEVHDGWDIVEWAATQSWSNGRVGAYGISYTGTTADLLTAVGHPALKAVVVGWSDFETWRSPVRPYGLVAEGLMRIWSDHVGRLDRNASAELGRAVRRVDADADGSQRAAAVKEHQANAEVYQWVTSVDFRDQPLADGTVRFNGEALSFAELSAEHWKTQIEASGVPMLVLASWLDAGVAAGALERFQTFSNPQNLVILASSHGGRLHASPYVVDTTPVPPVPSLEEQIRWRVAFFDHHLKGAEAGVEAWPAVRYFHLGEELFRSTDVWPPKGQKRVAWYLREGASLAVEPPAAESPAAESPAVESPGHEQEAPSAAASKLRDSYTVDFEVTTGMGNRWMTQMGQPILGLADRGAMDARMLTYTSPPLAKDLEITGTPFVTLHLSSSHVDGMVLAYLEDVDLEGRSRYLTEGGLRLIHRKENASTASGVPVHTFGEADALPMVPGEVVEVRFSLWPISARLRAGHRLRLALAGADAGTFARLPAEGQPELTVERSAARPSALDLPVIDP